MTGWETQTVILAKTRTTDETRALRKPAEGEEALGRLSEQ